LDFVELYSEYSQDDNDEIRVIVVKGIHEVLELIEKQGKNPFTLEESFLNFLKSSGSTQGSPSEV
jgi:hypothetical protein